MSSLNCQVYETFRQEPSNQSRSLIWEHLGSWETCLMAFESDDSPAREVLLKRFAPMYRRKLYPPKVFEVPTARVRLEVDLKTWEIFEAGQLENLPAPQVAMRFGVKVTTIYSINYRILKRLRELCHKLDQPKSTSLEGDTCHP